MFQNSSPQRGEEAILSEQERTLGVQVRGEIDSHSESNEESKNRWNFTNNASLSSAQEDETKHVIVSESETIQPIANQNQLQGNKYAPTSKSKISVLPQGVDMRSNSSPQRGEEAIQSELKRTLGVQVRGKIE